MHLPHLRGEERGAGAAAPDDFGRAVSKVAVAQLCDAAGFHQVRDSALDAFVDVAIRYLLDLGKIAEFYANLAGRSQCSVFDLILGLEDFGSGGAGGQSQQQRQCLVGSDIVRELVNYVSSLDGEVPFAQPIAQFPVIRERKNIPSFVQMGEKPPAKHIPDWLPALPDPHTYIYTPVWNERTSDPREDKIEQARQRRKAERSLLSLQKRLLCGGNGNGLAEAAASTATTTSVVLPDSAAPSSQGHDNPEGVVDKNLLLPGNKDVYPVSLHSKLSDEAVDGNRFSVLEAFTPAIEMMKSAGLSEDGVDGKMVLPVVRPAIHFKLRTGKKLIGELLDTRHQIKDASRTASLAGREDERDDKKRRAEYILKQSMENPQELTLL